jgi:hypothetical protein
LSIRAAFEPRHHSHTFEFLPNIGHLFINALLLQVPNSGSANIRDELAESINRQGYKASMPPYLSKASHVGGHFGSVEKLRRTNYGWNNKKNEEARQENTGCGGSSRQRSGETPTPTANGTARARATTAGDVCTIHVSFGLYNYNYKE